MSDSQSNPDPRLASGIFRFGPFVLDRAARTLRRDGEEIRLQPRVYDLLVALLLRPGEAISKDELVAGVWRGQVVGDAALARAVSELRRALGDPASEPIYVVTVPRIGVRFDAPVERTGRADPAPDTAPLWEGLQPRKPDRESIGAEAPPTSSAPPDAARRRFGFAMAAVAAAAAGFGIFAWRRARTQHVLGVFDITASDSDAAAYAPVVTDLVRDALASSDGLVVRPVASSNASVSEIARAARELGITRALATSLAHDGGKLAFSARLLDAEGRVYWSHHTAPLDSPTAVVDALAGALVTALDAPPTRDTVIDAVQTRRLDAAREFVLGRAQLRTRRAELAQPAFARALALDPAHAPSQAGLALTLAMRAGRLDRADVTLARAEALASEALGRNPDLAFAHLASGFVAMRRDIEPPEAIEAKLGAALARDPALTDAHVWRSTVRLDRGFVREAIEDLERAHAQDPSNPTAAGNLVMAYSHAGRWAEAEVLLHRAHVTLADPRRLDSARYNIAAARGRLADAVEIMLPYLAVDPTLPLSWSMLAGALARLGDRAGAHAALARLDPSDPATVNGAAGTHVLLGDAAALDALLTRPFDASGALGERERRLRSQWQGVAHAIARRWTQAIATLAPLFAGGAAVRSQGGDLLGPASVAQWLALALREVGERDRARALLDAVAAQLEVRAAHGASGFAPELWLAARNAALRDARDEAFELLEQAVAAGAPDVVTLRHDPRWDTLRGDARFAPILAQALERLTRERNRVAARAHAAIEASATPVLGR
ncbi:MAG TPA: winged helix-turn-helix domain-containing protein [Candidatus Saccharimonadia bacterium]|nr:winged helix-turn-helix domain-containing protein [Candidatus Saccharimonadia bacterium]